jgi:RecA/RadA recombinase
MEKLPTQCKAVDLMVDGGLAAGTITQIFGDKALGKSLLSFQAAFATVAGGHSAIILDTEQSYHSYLIEPWRERLNRRFGKEIPIGEVSISRRSAEREEQKEKPKSERKKFVPRSQVVTAISSALNRLEVPYTQSQLDSATDIFSSDLYVEPFEVKEPSVVVVQVPEVADLLGMHGVEGEKALSEGGRVELHLLRTPSYHSILRQMVKDTGARLVVYDSISAPFKASFPSTQDLPARSASLSMMLTHAQRLCVEYAIAVVAVAHVSVNPINPWVRRPYGGAILGYEAKFSLELARGVGKKEESDVAVNPEDETKDAKVVWLARHPAAAEYSRYGFLRIDEEGIH